MEGGQTTTYAGLDVIEENRRLAAGKRDAAGVAGTSSSGGGGCSRSTFQGAIEDLEANVGVGGSTVSFKTTTTKKTGLTQTPSLPPLLSPHCYTEGAFCIYTRC